MPWSAAVVLLCAEMLAQSAAPACPAGLPVDDIIKEIHQQQSKRKHRNRNPLPQVVCIFALCFDFSRTPPTLPEPAAVARVPDDHPTNGAAMDSSSLSRDTCEDATRAAVDAAHNVDVGDYYFETRNYAAATVRYSDALEQKPDDPAIHFRLARALEKLKEFPPAIEQYKAVEKLQASGKWSHEAKGALLRLERLPGP